MKLNYNAAVSFLMVAYSVPGLFLAYYIPFLENFLRPVNIGPLVAAALIQALLFYLLFPKIDLLKNDSHLRTVRKNRLGIYAIVVIFLMSALFVLVVQIDALMKFTGCSDRGSLYQAYRELAEIYSLEKIKTFIAVAAVYLVISGFVRLGLGTCIVVSAIDFGFGNRGFAFYTIIIVIFAFMPLASNRRDNKLVLVSVFVLILLILLRAYIFSGDSEIHGIDHLLAVFGEFVFTSSAPLFVHQMEAQGDLGAMLIQLLGIDKILGMRATWVGEIIQNDFVVPIGLACGPLCEIYYYAPHTTSLLLTTTSIAVLYAMFVWLSLKVTPPSASMPIVVVQVLLLRDVIRTGLVISFSTFVLWTLIALALSRIFFMRQKNEFS